MGRTILLSSIIGRTWDRNFLFRKQPILGIEELSVNGPISLEKIERVFYGKAPTGYEIEVLAWRPLGNQRGLMIEGMEAVFDEVEKMNEGAEVSGSEDSVEESDEVETVTKAPKAPKK